MTWTASLLLLVLQLVLSFLKTAQARQLIRAGEDKAIAKASLAVLDATEHGKRLHDLILSYNDAEADELWERMTDVT